MNTKIVSIISYILMGVSVVLVGAFYAGVITEEPIIIWSYGLAIVASAIAVIFPLYHLIKDPRGAKPVVIGLVALLVITGISYGVASDEVLPSYAEYGTTPFTSKLVSTGLILFYLLAGGAIIASVYAEVSKIFK